MAAEDTIEETKVEEATSPEGFDLIGWAGGTSYPEARTTIYRDGTTLKELIAARAALATAKDAAPKPKRKQVASIVDDPDESADPSVLAAQALVDKLQATLQASGITFVLRGIAPKERELLDARVKKSLAAVPATYEEIEGVRVQTDPGHDGGQGHPDYGSTFGYELCAKTIREIVTTDGVVHPVKYSAAEMAALEGILPGVEYIRLNNEVYDCNYLQYNINLVVDKDF